MDDSDTMENFMLFPLSDLDNGNSQMGSSGSEGHKSSAEEDDEDEDMDMAFKPLYSLRQRRRNMLGLSGAHVDGLNINVIAAQARAHRVRRMESEPSSTPSSSEGFCARMYWQRAFRKIRMLKDPWIDYHIEKYPKEIAIRHRYNALKKKWSKDEVEIKMEDKVSCFGLFVPQHYLRTLELICGTAEFDLKLNVKGLDRFSNPSHYLLRFSMIHSCERCCRDQFICPHY